MKDMWIKILLVSSIVLYSCNKTKLPEIPDEPKLGSIEAVNITKVSRVIGPSPKGETVPNPNNTMKRFGIGSTDYGNMWDAGNGKLWCIFGDNFDDRGGSWRSNAVAISSDKDLSDGLYYEDVLRDKDNKLMELIVSGAKTGKVPDEITCIPTAGVSVDNRQYINYMSVREWKLGGDNDSWLCNYSEIVYSDDYGKTWIRSGVKWDGLSKFVQVAYLRMDDTLYMYGTPAGRHSYVYLAKVAVDKVLDKSAYKYWDGVSWSSSEEEAAPIANGEVSEMTVQYNSYFKCYIMMYLSVKQRKLIYRDAANPQGEWSEEKIALTDGYGPYIHPWFCDGKDLWFVLSSVTKDNHNYDTWHIHLYHAELKPYDFNMIWEPGFEYDADQSISYKTLWNTFQSITSRDVHSGKFSCKTTNNKPGQWIDACTQTIVVQKNKDYKLSAWAKSSVAGHTGAYLGARLPDGKICDTNPALNPDEWTKIEIIFNSGNNTNLDVFFGTWGAENLSVLVDDFCLMPNNN